jgi:hypothetical protein
MCSHIIILVLTLKLVEFLQASMQIPIDQIRKRGRPRLCEVSAKPRFQVLVLNI